MTTPVNSFKDRFDNFFAFNPTRDGNVITALKVIFFTAFVIPLVISAVNHFKNRNITAGGTGGQTEEKTAQVGKDTLTSKSNPPSPRSSTAWEANPTTKPSAITVGQEDGDSEASLQPLFNTVNKLLDEAANARSKITDQNELKDTIKKEKRMTKKYLAFFREKQLSHPQNKALLELIKKFETMHSELDTLDKSFSQPNYSFLSSSLENIHKSETHPFGEEAKKIIASFEKKIEEFCTQNFLSINHSVKKKAKERAQRECYYCLTRIAELQGNQTLDPSLKEIYTEDLKKDKINDLNDLIKRAEKIITADIKDSCGDISSDDEDEGHNTIDLAIENAVQRAQRQFEAETKTTAENAVQRAQKQFEAETKTTANTSLLITDPSEMTIPTIENGAGIVHAKGKRDTMEDQHLIKTFTFERNGVSQNADVFAIFDGHAGTEAAIYAKENLIEYLQHHLKNENEVYTAFKRALPDLAQAFFTNQPNAVSGTTAAIVIKMDQEVYVLNVGDSRVLIDSAEKGFIQATEDAEPLIPKYEQDIEKRGGFISGGRVHGSLAPARAIGDATVSGVSARPTITRYDLQKLGPSTFVICCDGLFEKQTSKEVLEQTRELTTKNTAVEEVAKQLVINAFRSKSGDNLSAIVVQLAPTLTTSSPNSAAQPTHNTIPANIPPKNSSDIENLDKYDMSLPLAERLNRYIGQPMPQPTASSITAPPPPLPIEALTLKNLGFATTANPQVKQFADAVFEAFKKHTTDRFKNEGEFLRQIIQGSSKGTYSPADLKTSWTQGSAGKTYYDTMVYIKNQLEGGKSIEELKATFSQNFKTSLPPSVNKNSYADAIKFMTEKVFASLEKANPSVTTAASQIAEATTKTTSSELLGYEIQENPYGSSLTLSFQNTTGVVTIVQDIDGEHRLEGLEDFDPKLYKHPQLRDTLQSALNKLAIPTEQIENILNNHLKNN